MIDWIYEINWLFVGMVTIGIFIGTEFGRRKMESKGEIFTFIPRRTHRVLGVMTSLSAVLLIESAKVAVAMPTSFHVWMLLFVTAAAFVAFGLFTSLEFIEAKRAVKKAVHKPGNT